MHFVSCHGNETNDTARVKQIVPNDISKIQIQSWKEAKFKQIKDKVLKTCKQCNTSGSNIAVRNFEEISLSFQ